MPLIASQVKQSLGLVDYDENASPRRLSLSLKR